MDRLKEKLKENKMLGSSFIVEIEVPVYVNHLDMGGKIELAYIPDANIIESQDIIKEIKNICSEHKGGLEELTKIIGDILINVIHPNELELFNSFYHNANDKLFPSVRLFYTFNRNSKFSILNERRR